MPEQDQQPLQKPSYLKSLLGVDDWQQPGAEQRYNFVGAGTGMSFFDRFNAAKRDPQWRLNVALKQQTLEMNRAQMLDAAAKREMGLRQKQGMAALNGLVASEGFSFSSPEHESKFWGIVSQYGFTDQTIKPYADRFESARAAKEKADNLDRVLSGINGNTPANFRQSITMGPNGPSVTLSQEPEDDVQRTYRYLGMAEEARRSGDVEGVKRYMGMARAYGSKAAPRGGQTLTVQDPDGRTINLSEGASENILDQPLAPGTLKQTQETLIGAETSLQLIGDIRNYLKPEYFGVRGYVGEHVFDRVLAQIPGLERMANAERIGARTEMKAVGEALLKSLSADSGGRLSDYDVRRVKEFSDIMGVATSVQQASAQLDALEKFITIRAKVAASISGANLPPSMMSKEDWIKKFDDEVKVLQDKLTMSELTQEEYDSYLKELSNYIGSEMERYLR